MLISGVPDIDLEDFKRNTDYSGYNPTDQIIIWFWEVVSEYSQEDLAKLIQFITGTSKIPLEGFSHLIGMNGIQRISIHRDPIDYQLPKSHTCFNQLDLPNYATKEILKQKLGICLAWGSEGFGFMWFTWFVVLCVYNEMMTFALIVNIDDFNLKLKSNIWYHKQIEKFLAFYGRSFSA